MAEPKSGHDALTTQQITDEYGLNQRLILKAFKAGELRGRNLAGNKGWLTTRRAVTQWIEGRNGDEALLDAEATEEEKEWLSEGNG